MSERLLDLGFTRADLPLVRVRLGAALEGAGLADPARGAFVQAVLEVVTNAVLHGGGEGRLTAVAADGPIDA